MSEESPLGNRPVALGRVGARIAELRQEAGLTQQQFGERCYEHAVTIARLESNQHEPHLRMLLKVAAVLDVPVADLCAGVVWDAEHRHFQ